VLALAFGLGAGAARPARADDAAEAKVHYQKATAHFAVGEYSEAAAEYEAAYKLKQDPAILFNAAQAHRLAGNGSKALLLYNNVIKLYPTSRYATDAKERISKIEPGTRVAPAPVASSPSVAPPVQPLPSAAEKTAPPAPANAPLPLLPAPATAATTPMAPPASSTSPPTGVATAAIATSPPPAERESAKPIYARWWFWAAAAGVVAIGVVAVVALSSSSSGTSDPFSTNLPAISGGIVHW
jgi:hypothetical protein